MMRVLFIVLLAVSLFVFPSALTLVLAVCGIFLFQDFYEALIVAYLADVLYRGVSGVLVFPSWAFVTVFVIFIASFKLKEVLRIYHA